jgi:hypothetical protein
MDEGARDWTPIILTCPPRIQWLPLSETTDEGARDWVPIVLTCPGIQQLPLRETID